MIQSVCILGRQPSLGLAELESLYGASNVSLLSPQVASLTVPSDEIAFCRLGGSTRLAKVIAQVPNRLWKDVEKQLAKSIVQIANTMPEGKIQLGISAYHIPVTSQKLTATGLTLKKIVRGKTGRSLRLTPNNELELNTAQVFHNHLTGQLGIEFLVCATPDGQTVIAQTLAVQDIDSYTLRDRGRPKRDARVGMLPPKLAQIITNLAVADAAPSTETVILDPFCGTGVLLQEAMLMGYSVTGTDLEPRMISYSRDNLAWFTTEFGIRNSKYELTAGDAMKFVWQGPVSFIATETYLGRPFTETPDHEILEKTVSEVSLILRKFLRNIHGQLTADTRLCLAVPAWQLSPDTFRHLPLVDQIDDLGYNRIRLEHVRDDQLIYYREGQIVARELLILRRK
jgi:tRNA G10  N-methylase Trm11